MDAQKTGFVSFHDGSEFMLDCGRRLSPLTVAYETWGTLGPDRSNAILVCHALTGSSHAGGTGGWWSGLIGPGKALDTTRYFVVCPNILGSCYGTTGPASVDPLTGNRYGAAFPPITVRDMVRAQKGLLDALGIRSLATVIGSSLGGMQVLEWLALYPACCRSAVPISTAAVQPAWCIAFNTAARGAITTDPSWNHGDYAAQPRGLALARMIGMISYRSAEEFEARFGRDRHAGSGLFAVESYLLHQGRKLVDRFDANSYLCLTRAMDRHDLFSGRRGPLQDTARCRVLSIGVSSDVRYPTACQKEIAGILPGAEYAEIESIHGHDAFLIEYPQLNRLVGDFLADVEGTGRTRRYAVEETAS